MNDKGFCIRLWDSIPVANGQFQLVDERRHWLSPPIDGWACWCGRRARVASVGQACLRQVDVSMWPGMSYWYRKSATWALITPNVPCPAGPPESPGPVCAPSQLFGCPSNWYELPHRRNANTGLGTTNPACSLPGIDKLWQGLVEDKHPSLYVKTPVQAQEGVV